MDLRPEGNRTLLLFVAVLASAALLFFGTGLHPVWWMMWLAPLPILLVAPRARASAAFVAATAAWIVGALNMCRYFLNVLGPPKGAGIGVKVLSWLPIVLVLIVPACLFGLAVLLFRVFARRGQILQAALSLPVVWVAVEYLNAISSPHSTFGNLAYSQMDFLPFVQLVSVTGIWGISFFLLLFPATIAVVLTGRAGVRKRATAISVGSVLLMVLGFGWWRLHSTPTAPSVMVGLVASDTRDNVFPQEPEQTPRLMHDYMNQVRQLASEGAKIVVLPEKLGVVIDPQSTKDLDQLLDEVSHETGTQVVVGVIRRSSTAKLNEARWYSNSDGAPLFYEKEHMLPAFESSFKVGTERVSHDEKSGKWGVAICKDMDFPQLSRSYGADGVGLMLVPAWDFEDDGWLHGRMAILRGVESGFSIARAPKEGLLTITDDRGRVLAERSTGASAFSTLIAAVPVRSDDTIYRRFGDWFAWLNLGVLAWLLFEAFTSKSYKMA